MASATIIARGKTNDRPDLVPSDGATWAMMTTLKAAAAITAASIKTSVLTGIKRVPYHVVSLNIGTRRALCQMDADQPVAI